MEINIGMLIPFLEDNKCDVKIHLAQGEKDDLEPFKEFQSGNFKGWQEHQTKRNFPRKYILSLIWCNPNNWLFAGVYESLSVKKIDDKHFEYDTILTEIGKEFIGKAIFEYERNTRPTYRKLENFIEKITLLEIRRDIFTPDFPGYDKVIVSWMDLKAFIDTKAWKTALQNQKGVYLITDASNGKMYVGSAYGEEMLWGRWKTYIDTCHGGNKELKALGKTHIQNNFHYSILEIFKSTTEASVIIEREEWWKKVLKTKSFGYNA